jgi:hypothetical protein
LIHENQTKNGTQPTYRATTGNHPGRYLFHAVPPQAENYFSGGSALIAAWLPGTEGEGVADVLFGDYNPTGKLSRAWPSSSDHLSALDKHENPYFPLGFGLSY